MAERGNEHASMRYHPKRAVAKTWIFHPEEGKKCLIEREANDLLATGEWYESPADFPAARARKEKLDEKQREVLAAQQRKNAEAKAKAAAHKRAEAERLLRESEEDAETAEALLDEATDLVTDDSEEEFEPAPTGSEDAESGEQDDPVGKIDLPAEAKDWKKAQLEDFVLSNNLNEGKGLDLRRGTEKLYEDVLAMVQDHNAGLN